MTALFTTVPVNLAAFPRIGVIPRKPVLRSFIISSVVLFLKFRKYLEGLLNGVVLVCEEHPQVNPVGLYGPVV